MQNQLKKYLTNLLSRREYCKQEVTKKLQRKFAEASLDEINELVDRFEELGIISDYRFTEIYVRYGLNKNWGKSRIHRQLIHKGVSKEVLEKYFSENGLEIDLGKLCQTVQKKFRINKLSNLSFIDEQKIRKKIENYLIYRGHNFNDIKCILENLR